MDPMDFAKGVFLLGLGVAILSFLWNIGLAIGGSFIDTAARIYVAYKRVTGREEDEETDETDEEVDE